MAIRRLILLLVLVGTTITLLCADGPSAQLSDRYMPLERVKPGMKGICRTVLSGVKIESIPVEVIGVMSDVRPSQAIILVRLKGPLIEKSGVVQGMSGSPVYVNGKIIGSLAYAWPYATEPLAGLTPIEEMLKLGSEGGRTSSSMSATSAARVDLGTELINPLADLSRWFASRRAERPHRPVRLIERLEMPLCVSGFSPVGFEMLRESLPGANWSVVQGGGLGRVPDDVANVKLQPGSSICVEAIRGDVVAFGIGTVTDVIGDRVLALGHAMNNEGRVNLMMSTGYVQMVVPRRTISFKYASPVKPVGTLLFDQNSGVMGRLGKVPKLVPVQVTLHHADGRAPRKFRFEVTDQQKIMLSFLNAASASCLTSHGQPAQEATVRIRTRIELEGYPPLETINTYAGPKALAESMRDFVNPCGYIIHNPFERPRFKSIQIEATVEEGRHHGRAAIMEVVLPRRIYRAGQTVTLTVTMLPVRAERVRYQLKIPLPENLPPGRYSLTVCDAETDLQLDAGDRQHLYRARSLGEILKILGRPHPRKRLICRLSTQRRGVAVAGRAFGRVPGSVLSILGGQSRSDVVAFQEPLRVEKEVPYVVVGTHTTQLEVLPPEP